MATNKRKLAMALVLILFMALAGACSSNFGKLDFSSPDRLRSELNKFLVKSYPYKLPDFKEEKSIDLDQYFVAQTENGLGLSLTKDYKKTESITLEMPIEKKGDEAAANEFLAYMAAVINKYSGFDYIEPITNSLILEGVKDGDTYYSQYDGDGFVYQFSINLNSGYIFSVVSK